MVMKKWLIFSMLFHGVIFGGLFMLGPSKNYNKPKKYVVVALNFKASKIKNNDLPDKVTKKKLSKYNKKIINKPKKEITKKESSKYDKKIINKSKKEITKKELSKYNKKITNKSKKEITQRADKNKNKNKKLVNNLKKLAESFSQDIISEDNNTQEKLIGSEFFEQVYILIKNSFIVPSYYLSPAGKDLMATLRLFLSSSGEINSIKLEKSSGDSEFDRAVLESTDKIGNFGRVPLLLQESVTQEGILVDLCPLECGER